jgi:hypothetical protein
VVDIDGVGVMIEIGDRNPEAVGLEGRSDVDHGLDGARRV